MLPYLKTLPRAVLACVILTSPALADMTLELPGLVDGTFSVAQVFSGFDCDGLNQSPEMIWSGAPPEAKSFVITAYDPDAPTGSGFWHWSAFNIPSSMTRLDEGAGRAMPAGSVTARNDFSHNQYDGACPPEGSTHRYIVTVFAMPMERLPLDAAASAAMVGYFATTRAVAKASVTVPYGH